MSKRGGTVAWNKNFSTGLKTHILNRDRDKDLAHELFSLPKEQTGQPFRTAHDLTADMAFAKAIEEIMRPRPTVEDKLDEALKD